MKTRTRQIVVAFVGAFLGANAYAGSMHQSMSTALLPVGWKVAGYTGNETLKDFPLPVRLSEQTVPGFHAGVKGVAFSDTEGRPLAIDVERWNPEGESLVWVRVPELKRGTRIKMRVTESFSCAPAEVWGAYAGVWHFAEDGGAACDALGKLDAVPTGWVGTNAMVSTLGPSGRARVLADREPACFTVGNSERLAFGGCLTFSGWYRSDRPNPTKIVRLVTRTADRGWWSSPGGWGVALNGLDGLNVDGAKQGRIANIPDTLDGSWHHLSVSYEGTNALVRLDGVTCELSGLLDPAGDPEAPLLFGIPRSLPSNPITLRGAVDEFRLRKGVVSEAWAKAEYEALANPCFVVRDETLPVVPRVTSWMPGQGSVRIELTVEGRDADGKVVASQLTDDMRLMFGRGTKAPACGILLAVDRKVSPNPEGYRLVVSPSGVSIVGASRTGLYWGTRTLLQLLDAAPDKRTLACGTVDDAPVSRRRGFMLDVGRKFFPLAYLRDMAKVMAYYKMNDFHLHLNDNGGKEIVDDWKDDYAAFRMECETYPGLTAKDGSYGKDEFRQFVKDAAKVGVQVVPEIDAPAHSLAFTRYRPDFEKKDHDPAHIELKNPDVIPFFDRLWAEYLGGADPVFAGPVVHVGSDEYWAKEAELFREFLDHMLGTIQSYGKTPRAWGSLEHCRGKTPVRSKGVELDIWYNPYYSAPQALATGYSVIAVQDNDFYICPACGYYNDYLNLPWIYKYWLPHYIGCDEVEPDHPRLLGGAFAVWNDHIGNGISCDDVTDRAFPALQVMAEKLWHGKDGDGDYGVFAATANRMAEAPGVNLRDRVRADADGVVDLGSAPAVGWTQQGGWTATFELTVDGNEPKDTVLFDDGTSQVCLNLGGTGRFGFRRDGYDCVFKDPLPTGRLAVKMTGDAKGASLYLNGKFVERLEKPRRVVTKKGYKIAQVETLHFPFARGKAAEGRVGKLEVRLGCPQK